MDKNQFAAFLACAVVPPIMQQIQQKENQNTLELVKDFYHSKVYIAMDEVLKEVPRVRKDMGYH